MCNLYKLENAHEATARLGDALGRQPTFPEGIPNFEPRAEIRITDRASMVRIGCTGELELVQRRWSWPLNGGKPLYNLRSEGRNFPNRRCLVLADGFYEFTKHTDPKSKRKHKWLFTMVGEPMFAIAGVWRDHPDVGEAFTLLTSEPSPDIAPYHHRSIVLLPPADWVHWLDESIPSAEMLKPLPAGRLAVEQIN